MDFSRLNISDFWNEAAKWGLIIGAVMGLSRVFEYQLILSGQVANYAVLSFEWVVVAMLFTTLLYKAMLKRALLIYDSVGFSFGQMLNYALIVSILASVIVSTVTIAYINFVVGGYVIYINALSESVMRVMNEANVEGAMLEYYTSAFKEIQSSDIKEPTVFNTLLSTMSTYILAGSSAGVVATFLVKRNLKKVFKDE